MQQNVGLQLGGVLALLGKGGSTDKARECKKGNWIGQENFSLC